MKRQSSGMRWRLGLWLFAALATVVPPSGPFVEAYYTNGLFPLIQQSLTTISNGVPLALFDLLLVGLAISVCAMAVLDLRRGTRGGWARAAWRIAVRLVTVVAGAYLAFLLLWGLNYRRPPITTRITFDAARVTSENARRLANDTVRRVNALYAAAHREADRAADDASGAIDPALARAFADALPLMGNASRVRPGRPKRTILDVYFRRAGVAGMTDPYFLETLVASDLLPIERPMVIAHEWSHLAGTADEGEANYAGWLVCLHGSALHQYSGWLALYSEVMNSLGPVDARRVATTLDEGPRADLDEIRARLIKNINPALSATGWRVYDQYLKANRVDRGTESYAEVVRLVLGAGWPTEERAPAITSPR